MNAHLSALFFAFVSVDRPCIQWWNILPIAYKIFVVLICLSVVLLAAIYTQKYWRSNASSGADRKANSIFVPNPEYVLPPSYSTLHLFSGGAVCSDSKQCSEIGA